MISITHQLCLIYSIESSLLVKKTNTKKTKILHLNDSLN